MPSEKWSTLKGRNLLNNRIIEGNRYTSTGMVDNGGSIYYVYQAHVMLQDTLGRSLPFLTRETIFVTPYVFSCAPNFFRKGIYSGQSDSQSSETCFNKSEVIDHIVKANHVIDLHGVVGERAKLVDRENNQRLRQVKGAIWISQSPHPL